MTTRTKKEYTFSIVSLEEAHHDANGGVHLVNARGERVYIAASMLRALAQTWNSRKVDAKETPF